MVTVPENQNGSKEPLRGAPADHARAAQVGLQGIHPEHHHIQPEVELVPAKQEGPQVALHHRLLLSFLPPRVRLFVRAFLLALYVPHASPRREHVASATQLDTLHTTSFKPAMPFRFPPYMRCVQHRGGALPNPTRALLWTLMKGPGRASKRGYSFGAMSVGSRGRRAWMSATTLRSFDTLKQRHASERGARWTSCRDYFQHSGRAGSAIKQFKLHGLRAESTDWGQAWWNSYRRDGSLVHRYDHLKR